MMEKFTKGPWSPYGGLIYAPAKGDDVVVAATGSNNPVSEANARLIAAAPEMYAMIKRIVDCIEDDRIEDFAYEYYQAKDLLSKARGGQ